MYKETFEKLFIWKESKELFVNLCDKFTKTEFKDYFYKNQLLKATLSISNNIADGYERPTGNDLMRFFGIAKWSAGEVRSMLIIWKDLWYFIEEEYSKTLESVNKIMSWIVGFIKSKDKKEEFVEEISA